MIGHLCVADNGQTWSNCAHKSIKHGQTIRDIRTIEFFGHPSWTWQQQMSRQKQDLYDACCWRFQGWKTCASILFAATILKHARVLGVKPKVWSVTCPNIRIICYSAQVCTPRCVSAFYLWFPLSGKRLIWEAYPACFYSVLGSRSTEQPNIKLPGPFKVVQPGACQGVVMLLKDNVGIYPEGTRARTNTEEKNDANGAPSFRPPWVDLTIAIAAAAQFQNISSSSKRWRSLQIDKQSIPVLWIPNCGILHFSPVPAPVFFMNWLNSVQRTRSSFAWISAEKG